MSRASPWLSLGVIGALSGVLWRVEVEHHGWEGLAWTGYFHLAVPVGIAMYLAWVAWWVDAPTHARRAAIVGVLAVYAAAAVPATEWSLIAACGRFAGLWGTLWFTLWWWLLAPTTVAGLLVACRTPPGWRRWLASQGLFALSPWLATAVIEVIPQHGSSDFLHAVKSGVIAPFLVFALGVVVPTRAPREQGPSHDGAGVASSPSPASV